MKITTPFSRALLLTTGSSLLLSFLSACSTILPPSVKTPPDEVYDQQQDGAPGEPSDLASLPEPIPRVEPRSRYGNPPYYKVLGKTYHTLKSGAGYNERGIASWYGTKFHGRRTSSGEPYDVYAFTAAHKTLPIPCYVQVTNLENGRKLIVRVNDRGPFHDNRVIDLSYAAAGRLGILKEGTGLVEVRLIDPQERAVPVETAGAGAVVAIPARPSLFLPVEGSTTTEADPTFSFYLQVGAFQSRANAERLRERLHSHGVIDTAIFESTGMQDGLYRVRVGPLSSVDEADRVTGTITGLGLAAPQFVVD